MEITGRLVADAAVRNIEGDRTVTNFRVAVNRKYVSGGEQREDTTFIDCAYWRSDAVAPYLTKGLLVQLFGHISARPWVNRDGEPMASLNFYTNEIRLLSASRKADAVKAKNKKDRKNQAAQGN
ncbi:single-stranded DNA-binding protein [Mucilaginibacter aquatilis]|uniref:Single-stranded DNA-binding protein n=1 Tax=Mucilaginibacter aquatilis TaxID=1517760 RepID=A0A6I4I897_9SPHI|nr:single-stranded DNA-binding protein [Mucilaginibacter aquatilis]MVN91465.1 single-stranded DNA-binding protein [Mucilaginibacter aquatilis]